jgi:hypothetical protein
VWVLAHELVHCVQFELAGGVRGSSEQWLREGFAEWASIRVLEELGAAVPGARLRQLQDEVRSARSPARSLDDIRTFSQWAALAARDDAAVYAQATLAVDRLIARHGISRVVEYFRLFGSGDDADVNFRRAFGRDRWSFEAEVAADVGLR